MANTGWISPGSTINMDLVIDALQGNTNNNTDLVKIQDNIWASCVMGKWEFADYIRTYNYDFASLIPAGSVLLGVEVRIDKYGSGANVWDIKLELGTTSVSGDDKGDHTTGWPTGDTDTYVEYGGAADTWNSGYNMATIRTSNFGCWFAAQNGDLNVGRTAYIDHIQIKITYTLPAGYGNDVNDVPSANIGSINDVPTANINTVNDT